MIDIRINYKNILVKYVIRPYDSDNPAYVSLVIH